MVASEESDESRILQFETQQQLEGLHGVVTSVNEVSHEDVSGVGYLSSFVEQLEQVMELAMDISTDGDRSLNRLDVAFLDQQLLHLLTENSEVSLRQDASVLHNL